MKHITFVDLDETLFHTYAKIQVKSKQGVKELSNTEFNTYKLKDGEEYDFTQFSCSDIFEKSTPIESTIQKIIDEHKENEVAILTARGDFIDKDKFIDKLKSVGLPVGHYKDGLIHVIRCGNDEESATSAESKLKMINKILKKRKDVSSISLIDDCEENLDALKDLPISVELFHADGHIISKYKK